MFMQNTFCMFVAACFLLEIYRNITSCKKQQSNTFMKCSFWVFTTLCLAVGFATLLLHILGVAIFSSQSIKLHARVPQAWLLNYNTSYWLNHNQGQLWADWGPWQKLRSGTPPHLLGPKPLPWRRISGILRKLQRSCKITESVPSVTDSALVIKILQAKPSRQSCGECKRQSTAQLTLP